MLPNLFAFGLESFAAPALLWGLALGAAPILIHLLNKRKYRETSWAAMRFLLEAVRKNSRRLRIEQIVLLAVRTLLVLLVIFALAEPLVEDLGPFFQPHRPSHKIIVLDASLSMGFRPREESLFDRARQTARTIVEQARQGDIFNLARLSNIPPAVIVPTPAYQSASIIEEIEQMQLPHGTGDLVGCLSKVEDLLKLAPDVPQKEIYLISDFQRVTWAAESNEQAARVRQLLKKFDEAGRLVLIDLGQPDAVNVAVTSIQTPSTFVTTARPAPVRATIRNFGNERVTGRTLDFLVDERLVEQRVLDLAPGSESALDFSASFAYGGEHRLAVRLQSDALPLDDRRWLAIPVKDRIRVLCVSGSNSGQGRGTDFLELALSPGSSGLNSPATPSAGRSPIEPVVISEGEFQETDLSAYDCVFFCNVQMFTDREAQVIETYLKGGGGVVWCLGDQVSAENYNQVLYRQGKGCLPARLGDRQGGARDSESVFAFDPGDFTHSIVSAFHGNPDAGLETTLTYAYLKAIVGQNGPAYVALAFDSGDPAIVEAPFGRGKSILITTSIDDRWTTWPLWPSFVPLVHELVQFAVSGRWGDRQHLVGESLSEIFPATAVDVDVAVARPDGHTQPARITRAEAFDEFSYENTGESGIYEVNFAHPLARSELFAVNVDPRESNLAKLTPEEITGELAPGVDLTYLTSWREDEAGGEAAPAGPRGGLTRWILYAVIYLMLTEQTLAWDFRKGLWLLCPPIPAALWLFERQRKR